MSGLYLGADAVPVGGRPDDFQRDASDVSQGSAAWMAARCGKVTASNLWRVIKKTKAGWGADRKNYMDELITERILGYSTQHYVSMAMEWGIANEPAAAAAYEFEMNCDVAKCGFFDHPTIPMAGASPDRLVGDDGLLELKCPTTKIHLVVIETNKIDSKYLTQMHWQMACDPSRMWVDYCDFDSRVPEEMMLYVKRIPRDDHIIATLEYNVVLFQRELDERMAKLKSRAKLPKMKMSAAPVEVEEVSE